MLPISLTIAAWFGTAYAEVPESSYDKAIDLVERMYLRRDELSAADVLRAAADAVADDVDWLIVEDSGGTVAVRRGTGPVLGSATAARLHDLPEAFRQLEGAIRRGGPVGDVDVRLDLLRGMTRALDPHSRILVGEKLEKFDVRLKGTLVGIGTTMSLRDQRPLITVVNADSPAAQSGIRVGDVVLRIDGVSTIGMPLRDATSRIQGDVGSEVTLDVMRGGQELQFVLVRAEIVVPNVEGRVLADSVGYVRIDHFSQRTVENLVSTLDDLRRKGGLSRGLVIDLRGNTGGSMREAARSADQFVTRGMLIRTAGPDGGPVKNLQPRIDAEASGDEPDVPLVILVDEKTASGSEILAGSLLELKRAVLVGSRTYGKGTVQKIYSINDDVRFKLTVAEYRVANDRRIAPDGIVPDATVGEVRFDELGAHFVGFDSDRTHTRWEQVLPVVAADGRSVDTVLEIARRTVVRAEGARREDVLESLNSVTAAIRAEQEARLAGELEKRGIDWRAAPISPLHDAPATAARVEGTVEAVAAGPDVVRVTVKVENTGESPIYQGVATLSCETFAPFDQLVVPVGHIPAGGRGSGSVSVRIDPDVGPREDVVRASLRGDQVLPSNLGEAVLSAVGSGSPRVAVTARLVGPPDARQLDLALMNQGPTVLSDVEARVEHLADSGFELLDAVERVGSLEPKQTTHLIFAAKVGAGPARVPLRLTVSAKRASNLADFNVDVPRDGAAVVLDPPRITPRLTELSWTVGAGVLPVQVADDRAVDHVAVWQDGRKIAFYRGGAKRLDLRVPLTIRAGANRVVVTSEDDQHLRTKRVVMIRGESPPSEAADTQP